MTHDAIVIGGGPAGATAALALARAGRSVAVVERAAFPRRKVCGEYMSATNIALLDRLGLAEAWRAAAGPEVRRVGLFIGDTVAKARMPRERDGYGRALGRDVLDALLLDAAQEAGAEVLQPARAIGVVPGEKRNEVRVADGEGERTLCAPIVVAAHGSWEPGPLPTHLPRTRRAGDLVGFKAHFRNGRLAPDLMPLLAFPGGYGGMVHADGGRLSISCCIRRDMLERLRAETAGPAGDAVEAHLVAACRGVAEALRGAEREGPWLGAGPIRPGLRTCYDGGIFRVGNLAGEAHPIIAEGISIGLQSGFLLAEALDGIEIFSQEARAGAARRYTLAWRRQFAPRIAAASAFAHLLMSPGGRRVVPPAVRRLPALLTFGATLSGKTRSLPAATRP